MLRYTLFRILGSIPTLLLVIALAFLMVRAAPGGPFDAEYIPPADVEKNIRAAYDLDDPLPQQFLAYVSGLVRGDLGPSIRYTDYTVSELIGETFPYSLRLGAAALGLLALSALAGRLVADTRLADPAYREELWKGGPEAVAASMPPATCGLKPECFIMGIVKDPVATTLATALPATDPMNPLAITAVLAGPPEKRPVIE